MGNIKPANIIRTNRKTIALIVNSDATLTIRAPRNISMSAIERLIDKKHLWISRKIKEAAHRPKAWKKEFVNGESFLYLGKSYKLHIGNRIEEGIYFHSAFYLASASHRRAKEFFIKWYKQAGQRKITERVEWYAKKMGVDYKQVRITDAGRRWGSCSANGNLNFSWRLIMAPLAVVDYVVVHELAHLEVRSHSWKFWNKVRAIMPHYQEHRDWLKMNGQLLNI